MTIELDLPEKLICPVHEVVIHETIVIDQNIFATIAQDNAGDQVVPVKSIFFPSLGISAVITLLATKALLITTSSCGNGTRLVQPCVDQVKEAVPVAVCVAAVVNAAVQRACMVLPPQSPVYPAAADMFHDAAPAPVISIKSTLSTDITAAVSVRGVPTTSDCTSRRFVAEFPVKVRVPVIV